MKIKRITYFVLVLLMLSAVLWNRQERRSSGDFSAKLDLQTVQKVFPEGTDIRYHAAPFPYFSVYGKETDSGKLVLKGYAFRTIDIVPHITGYAGPIVLLVGVDPAYKILGVRILEHHETPSYTYGIEKDWWLKQFTGMNPRCEMVPDKDIDAISSATVTVAAICRSVKESLQKVSLGSTLAEESPGEEKIDFLKVFNRVEIYILLVLFFTAVPVYLLVRTRLRYIILFISFVYLGIKLKLFYSIAHLAGFLAGTFPQFDVASTLWVFLGLIFLNLFLFGRVYCGSICPFGAIQELIAKISPWKIRVSPAFDRRMKQTKIFFLWLLLVAAMLYPALLITNYEPFALTFTLIGFPLVWCFTLFVLLFSWIIERFYCRYFCLAGASLRVLTPFSLTRLKMEGDCANCQLCEQECPMQTIQNSSIHPEECIVCNRCRKACPRSNIKIKKRLFDA